MSFIKSSSLCARICSISRIHFKTSERCISGLLFTDAGHVTPLVRRLSYPLVSVVRCSIQSSTRTSAADQSRCSTTRRSSLKRTKTVLKEKFVGIRENVLTYPNGLSLIRIGLTPVLAFCILNHYYISSLSIFTVAGITDVLDGYIARNFPNQKSVLGSVLDPLADKLLVATVFLSLSQVDLIPGQWTVFSLPHHAMDCPYFSIL